MSPIRAWVLAALGAGLALAAVLVTCSHSSHPPARTAHEPPARDGAQVRLATRAELTPAEIRYGLAPHPDPSVTYQPDVIIVGGGAESIRALSDDGLTWTIDAAAPRARELEPGKIMFVTGRAIGRVLALRPRGDALDVVAGPVDLTDVIRDCDIHLTQPVDLRQSLSYSLPAMPGAAGEVEPLQPAGRSPAIYRPGSESGELLRVATETEINVESFTLEPIASVAGIGMHISNHANGLELDGEILLRLGAPMLHLDLAMRGGRVQRALVRLDGAAGLFMGFKSLSSNGWHVNINKQLQLPVDLSIPFLGPVPLSITLRQQFIVQTAFSANGTIEARGDFQVQGALNAGYTSDRGFQVSGPSGFTARESLLKSVNGISLGPAGFVLTHQIKVIAGLGQFGFTVGPYVAMNSSMAVYRYGATDVLARCEGAQFKSTILGGVGYVVPNIVVRGINLLLHALNIKPISDEGGFKGPSSILTWQFNFKPQSEVCKPDGEPDATIKDSAT